MLQISYRRESIEWENNETLLLLKSIKFKAYLLDQVYAVDWISCFPLATFSVSSFVATFAQLESSCSCEGFLIDRHLIRQTEIQQLVSLATHFAFTLDLSSFTSESRRDSICYERSTFVYVFPVLKFFIFSLFSFLWIFSLF